MNPLNTTTPRPSRRKWLAILPLAACVAAYLLWPRHHVFTVGGRQFVGAAVPVAADPGLLQIEIRDRASGKVVFLSPTTFTDLMRWRIGAGPDRLWLSSSDVGSFMYFQNSSGKWAEDAAQPLAVPMSDIPAFIRKEHGWR